MTGESPIVDIQSATEQRVIDQELLVAIPTGRTPQVAAFMIPGVNLSNVDVGGTNIINTTGGSLSIHGGSSRRHAAADRRRHHRQHRGHRLVGQHAAEHGQHAGSGGRLLVGDRREHHRRAADQHDPEDRRQPVLGLAVRHRGQLRRSRARNTDDELRARGLRTPNSLKLQSDVNPGLGGPLERDKLWFYTSARFTRQANYIGGLFQNKNAGDITKWTYEPDDEQARLQRRHRAEREPAPDLAGHARSTSSASSTTSTGAASARSPAPTVVAGGGATTSSTRSATCARCPTRRRRSNRLLVEARFGVRREEFAYTPNNLRSIRSGC